MAKLNNCKRQIVIITDCTDIAYNEMHQIITRELYGLEVAIAPVASVKSFSVVNASFVIRLLSEIYPAGTIFVVVVSGTNLNPERIFGETLNNLIFIGNNSGYFGWLLEDFGLKCIYKNKITRILEGRSFGGKYAQIPTAGEIAKGESFDSLGDVKDRSFAQLLDIPQGTVVHCDNFGLMKIKTEKIINLKEGDKVAVFVNGRYKVDAYLY